MNYLDIYNNMKYDDDDNLDMELNNLNMDDGNYDDNYEDNIFVKRIDCWLNTQEICKIIDPPSIPSVKVIYKNEPFTRKYEKSTIRFYNMDCVNLALSLIHLKPLVLNLSDDLWSGGWVASGSGASEESIFRRTNYFQSLLQNMYPILPNEAIYSSKISIIKKSEKENWDLIPTDEMQKLDFVACPALKYPETITVNNEKRLVDKDVEILKKKIKLIIQIAVDNNHDTIILGAMGCGAFLCPIKHVANIFKEVLEELDGVILNYFFAIMTTDSDSYIVKDHNKGDKPSIEYFTEVFSPNENKGEYIETL